jgi:hypothetical protein
MTAHLNAFGDDSEVQGNLDVVVSTPPAQQGPAPLPKAAKRVWIQLEDSDEIPPTGQFIGVNGRSYMLRAGEPAAVPEEVIEVLQDAVASVPVLDGYNNVVGYRERLRFPFRFVAAPRVAQAA